MRNVRRLVAVAMAITCASMFAGASARASDCYSKPPAYKTIVVYEMVEVPYVTYVTKYHPCGTAYRVKVVEYRTVKVAVEKRVKIG